MNIKKSLLGGIAGAAAAIIAFVVRAGHASAALVTCGTGDTPCQFSDFTKLVNNVLHFALFNLAIPIAIIMFVWGGISIMTSGGNEGKVKKGKDIITGTVVGLLIAFGAWLIVRTVSSVVFGQ